MSDQIDPDHLRALATHLAEQAADGGRHLLKEHSASFRWLMASLLAINGAGLLALKDLQLSSATFSLIAGGCFFAGITCALLVAYLGQKSDQKMIDPLSRLALYWRAVAMTGETDEDAQTDLDRRVKEAMKRAVWPSRTGFASLLFFAVGLIAIAAGWTPK